MGSDCVSSAKRAGRLAKGRLKPNRQPASKGFSRPPRRPEDKRPASSAGAGLLSMLSDPRRGPPRLSADVDVDLVDLGLRTGGGRQRHEVGRQAHVGEGGQTVRSEERRVGKEWVGTVRSRGGPYN